MPTRRIRDTDKVLPGNACRVAASHAKQCAQEALAFIERNAAGR